MKLPTEVARNQTPIDIPAIRAGDNVVMALRPTGDRASSPMVCRRYVSVSHIGLTWKPPSAACAGGTRMANPSPTKTRPNANLAGLDGSAPRDAILTHIHAKTGARIIRNSEFSDWNQLLGNGRPIISVRVLRSAKRLSVEPACSNTDQNSA